MLVIKNLREKKWINYVISLLFVFSGTALTALLSVQGPFIQRVMGVSLSFIIFLFLAFKLRILKKVFSEIKKLNLLISTIFSAVTAYYVAFYFYSTIFYYKMYAPYYEILSKFGVHETNYAHTLKIAAILLGAVAFFAIFVFWYCVFSIVIPIAVDFFTGLDKADKWFLVISAVVFSTLIIVVYSITNIFYSPTIGGKLEIYDIVFTSDTGTKVLNNIFVNIAAYESDFRHPLFGLYALPFGIIATILSKILFFVPNAYPVFLAIVQVPLLSISVILICKMLKVKGNSKSLLLLLFSISYPYILYSLCLEDYLIGTFYVIVFIYAFLENKGLKHMLFLGATGTFISSGILFPFISEGKKGILWIKDIAKAALTFISLVVVFGKLSVFLDFDYFLKENMKFTGVGVSFINRIYQYLSFIPSCFVKPATKMVPIKYPLVSYTASYPSYQLDTVTAINLLGITILALVILGFLLNYKNNFAKVCFFWVTFSFVVMCIVGWGTSENGLILYTIYFSWAYICLVYMAMDKLFSKIPKVKNSILAIISVSMLVINGIGILELIQFGFKYYPI